MLLPRRTFLKAAAGASALCLAGPAGLGHAAKRLGISPGLLGEKLSPFYKPLADGFVQCTLCPQGCQVGPGETGACKVRRNKGGKYYTLVYGNPCAVHVDPIEKKPFFHVLPATSSFSLATAGCNFICHFCQNWEISQKGPQETMNLAISPQEAVELALGNRAASVASTYVEPSIFMEYMLDINRLAREKGLLAVMHSNGYVNPAPRAELIKVLDAACIDLKSSNPDFYRDVCGGELEPVKDTLRALVKAGVHTEIVHLMIPTLNDGPAETRKLIKFVRDELSPQTPIHFTRFHPMYKLRNLPPTPPGVLTAAWRMAREMGMEYAYVGNLPGHPGENTVCPNCGRMLIQRIGYHIRKNDLRKGKCPQCKKPIAGIWNKPQKA